MYCYYPSKNKLNFIFSWCLAVLHVSARVHSGFPASFHTCLVNWDVRIVHSTCPRMQIFSCLYVALLWVGDWSSASPNCYRNKQVLKLVGWIVGWYHAQNQVPCARGCKTSQQHDVHNLAMGTPFPFWGQKRETSILNSALPFKCSPADLSLAYWEDFFKDNVPKSLCVPWICNSRRCTMLLADISDHFPLLSCGILVLMTQSKFVCLEFVYFTIIQYNSTVLDVMECLELAV